MIRGRSSRCLVCLGFELPPSGSAKAQQTTEVTLTDIFGGVTKTATLAVGARAYIH
jgi:hypothetical protein